MILLSPQKHQWTSDDRQRLDTFLKSPTGILLLGWLAYWNPSFECEDGDVNKSLGRVKGYQEAVERLVKLTVERPPEAEPEKEVTTEEYPSLDLPEGDPAWQGVDPQQPVDKRA